MFVLCPFFFVKSMSSLRIQQCVFFFSFFLFFSPNTRIHLSGAGKIHGKHPSIGLTLYRRKKSKANCLSFC